MEKERGKMQQTNNAKQKKRRNIDFIEKKKENKTNSDILKIQNKMKSFYTSGGVLVV